MREGAGFFMGFAFIRDEKSLLEFLDSYALTAGQELDLLVLLVEIAIELAVGAAAVILERVKIVIVFRCVCRVQGSLLSRDGIQGAPEGFPVRLPSHGNRRNRAGSQDQQGQHPPSRCH